MAVFEERGVAPATEVDSDATAEAALSAALLGSTEFQAWLDLPVRPRVALHHVEVDPVTQAEALDRVFTGLRLRRGGTVITPNLDIVRQAGHDHVLRGLIVSADLVLADGMPLVWASRITRKALPERVSGSDLVLPLCERAALEGRSVYLLGGAPGTADACAIELAARFPKLTIAGTHCPPHGFENDPEEQRLLRQKLADARPDIVLLALGTPKQEKLMGSLRDVVPEAWLFGVGAALDFIVGEQRRAPELLQRTGLEWTYRLACEPRRLARRYLLDGLPAAGRLGMWAVRTRLSAGERGPAAPAVRPA